jgi:iron complex outermembrane receptor protein
LKRSIIAALIAAAAPLALAQSPEDPAVIVTATRFPDGVLAAPVGVTVITSEDIRNSTATSVAEVLNKLGGVHTRINFLGTPDLPIDLRGFGVTGDQNSLVLLNGQRISENELAAARLTGIPLNAIERIEIVRGSGSVLYGGGTTGGTINIITAAPAAAPARTTLYGALGNDATRDLRVGHISAGETSGLALYANAYESDNFRRNNHAIQENLTGEWRLTGASGSIALRAGGEHQRSRLPGARTETELATDPRGTSTPNDYANLDGWSTNLAAQSQIGDLTLAADAGYRSREVQFFSDFGGGVTAFSDTNTQVWSVSPRLRWSGALLGQPNLFVLGVDYSDWSYRLRSAADPQGIAAPTTVENSGQVHQALYFQNHTHVTDALRLTIGARRERMVNSIDVPMSLFGTVVPPKSEVTVLPATELALRYQFLTGWAAYARSGKSFRVANVDENRCFSAPCNTLLPQTSRDNEVGFLYRRDESNFRASYFNIDLKNEIHFNALTFTNINLSPTRRRGAEIEGATRLGRQANLVLRYSVTDARFREGTYGGVDVAGNDVPLVPRQRASLLLGWRFDDATRLTFADYYVGRQRYDNDQANRFRKMPSYSITDVKLSHRRGSAVFSLGINNLFDKLYYSYAIVNDPTAPTTFNAYPERRRSLMATVELTL